VKNNISIKPQTSRFDERHFDLYKKYTLSRHADSEMAKSSETQFMDFLSSAWSDTLFIEILLDNQLLAVAVTDRQPASLSALYTFFDPEWNSISPGVIAILSQIEFARISGADWLYLGYWIEQCAKMAYKTQYRPIELFNGQAWQLIDK